MESSIADASEHPASRYRAGDGVLFSSSKAPPGPGPENSCELPLGFIWTPLSPTNNISVIQSDDTTLPPVLCLTCLAYLNIYASFDLETGVWICPLCESKNIAPKEAFATDGALSSVLVSPALEFRQSIVGATTAATDNPGDLDVCNIVLVLDTNLSCIEAQGVGSAIQSIVADIADNPCRINIGLIIFGQTVSIYQLGIYGIASADVFATHSGLTEDHLNDRSYLLTVEKGDSDLHNLMRCISAVYGISLSAENQENENGGNSTATATTSRMERLRERKEARIRKQQSSNSAGPGDDDEGYYTHAKSPWTVAKEEAKSAPPIRCTGEAIQCAIDLATAGSTNTARTSRILLFTDGCPNYGDGSVVSFEAASTGSGRERAVLTVDPHTLSRAVQYFDIIARSASEAGVAIDVFCTGALELGLPSYEALVLPSAGYVLPHATFATPHLRHNMGFVLKHTFVSTAPMNESEDDSGQPSSHREVWMDGCIIDLRTSSFLVPTKIVGPGEFVDEPSGLVANERSAFAAGSALAASGGLQTNNLPSKDMLESSLTRLCIGRCDLLSTFSVMLQMNDFFQHDKYAFFQCTARYVDRDGRTLVTRVFTHRLSVASTVGEFLDAIDEEVVPVLLGKEAVYRSMFGRETTEDTEVETPDAAHLESLAYDAQRDIDATIQRISGAFRMLGLEQGTRGLDLTEEGGVKAAGSSVDFAFPPELADALRRLYHLRRGPLVSPGPIQSMDDRATIRSLFIRLPLGDCLCMMAPSLWSSGPLAAAAGIVPSLETVPPETLALWENCIIGGDHYHNLFLWSGKGVVSSEFDIVREHIKTFLLERVKKRFPMPQLHNLSEGDSMSRRFTALLAPSHADPRDHQMAHFPALASLSPDELTALQVKFRFYDPSTDASFRNWFWEVASATSVSKDEGLSLCD